MFHLRVTRSVSTRSWQATGHCPRDLCRTYSILRRRSELNSHTTSSSPEVTYMTPSTPSAEGAADLRTARNGTEKKPSLLSRLSRLNASRRAASRDLSGPRSSFELEHNDPEVRKTETHGIRRNVSTPRSAFDAKSENGQNGRRRTVLRDNRSLGARRRTPKAGSVVESDGRGIKSLGAPSFLPARSAKSRDDASAKWLKEEDPEGLVDGEQGEYEEVIEFGQEEHAEDEEEDDFWGESRFDIIGEMDKMSEERVAEWERSTWADTIQVLRDHSTIERKAVATATYTNLKELFGPSSAPPDSPRLQALKELGGDYSSYLPSGYAAPSDSTNYARLALGRNKQISLEAHNEALRVIEENTGGRITRTG